MNYYELIMLDDNGCKWNFEDCEENVVIKAHTEMEATYIFLSAVDSEYEEEAKKYYARKIDDIIEYAENHYYTIWEWNESEGESNA